MLSKIVLFWHKTTALISERSSSHLYRSSRLENFYQLIFFCTFWLSIIWPGVIPASITSIYLGIWLLLLITRGTVLVDNTSHLSFRSANFRARREPCDAYRSRHLWHPVVLEIVGGKGVIYPSGLRFFDHLRDPCAPCKTNKGHTVTSNYKETIDDKVTQYPLKTVTQASKRWAAAKKPPPSWQ